MYGCRFQHTKECAEAVVMTNALQQEVLMVLRRPTHLVIAAYEMHVLGVLNLQRQQQADRLQRVCSPVDVVS